MGVRFAQANTIYRKVVYKYIFSFKCVLNSPTPACSLRPTVSLPSSTLSSTQRKSAVINTTSLFLHQTVCTVQYVELVCNKMIVCVGSNILFHGSKNKVLTCSSDVCFFVLFFKFRTKFGV